MPLTSTERSRIRRQKLKADAVKYEAIKAEESRKKKEYRHSKVLTEKQKEHIRTKNKEAQRKCRKKKVEAEKLNMSSPGYSSKQSLGKAVKKINNALPKSPNKKLHVLTNVISKMSPLKRKQIIESSFQKKRQQEQILKVDSNSSRRLRSDKLSEETEMKVKQFFVRDDISRMCPGKKDVISVKTPTGREIHQKRYLVMSIGESHKLFLSENPDLNIGMTKFHELRPKYVLPFGKKDQEVCMCIYHENISMILSGIGALCPDLPKNPEIIAKESVCAFDDDHISCIDRACSVCGVEKYLDVKISEDNLDYTVKYYQWQQNELGFTVKREIVTDLGCAKEEIGSQLQTFARHIYNASKQHFEFRYLKENLPDNEVIMHIDFAENYAIKHDREIMSAHWASDSVTVYTCVAYFKEENSLNHQSYAIISDDLSHSKDSVKVFNEEILSQLKQRISAITKVHYWSDGAASQFKNRFMFANLTYHKEELKIEADWSFFETAHGKGAVDGIGGSVKNRVWRAVLQGKEVVVDAKSFFNVASKISDGTIKIVFISKDTVERETLRLKERFSMCKSIPNTRSLHFIRPTTSLSVEFSLNSPFSSPQNMHQATIFSKITSKHATTSLNLASTSTSEKVFEEGQWIAVLFDDHWWPGQVMSVNNKNMTLKHHFKPVAENKFKYLEKPQLETISVDTYLSTLPCDPSPDHSARFFSYDSKIALKINNIINKL